MLASAGIHMVMTQRDRPARLPGALWRGRILSGRWDGVANFGIADASGYGEESVRLPAALAGPCAVTPLTDTRPAKFPKGSQG